MGKMKDLDYLLRCAAKDLCISYKQMRDYVEELAENEGISIREAIERICGDY